jgi:hypothetical protein
VSPTQPPPSAPAGCLPRGAVCRSRRMTVAARSPANSQVIAADCGRRGEQIAGEAGDEATHANPW